MKPQDPKLKVPEKKKNLGTQRQQLCIMWSALEKDKTILSYAP